jgi:hypothetical protein
VLKELLVSIPKLCLNQVDQDQVLTDVSSQLESYALNQKENFMEYFRTYLIPLRYLSVH